MDEVATEWAIISECYPETAGKNSDQIFDYGVLPLGFALRKINRKDCSLRRGA